MKLRLIHIVFQCVVVLYGGAYVNAAPPEDVTVVIRPSQSSLTIGDSLTVFCTVTAPEGFRTGEPRAFDSSPFLDTVSRWKKQEILDYGITREHYGFLTYVLNPDTLSVGPFAVEYTTPTGETKTATSNTLKLVVTGVLNISDPSKPPPPRPNRGPFEIASEGIPLWLVVLIITVIAVLAAVYFFYVRKRESPAVPPQPKPIDEIGEFERIRSLQLHEKGRIRELYILVSNAMRGFIHRNMEPEALYKTTEEIIAHLSSDSPDAGILDGIKEVLYESDMVKFARYAPPAESASTIIDRALEPVRAVLENIKREKEREDAEREQSRSEATDDTSPVTTAAHNSGGGD